MASFDRASVRKPDQGGYRRPIRAFVKDREDLASVRHSLSTAANALSLMVGGFFIQSIPE